MDGERCKHQDALGIMKPAPQQISLHCFQSVVVLLHVVAAVFFGFMSEHRCQTKGLPEVKPKHLDRPLVPGCKVESYRWRFIQQVLCDNCWMVCPEIWHSKYDSPVKMTFKRWWHSSGHFIWSYNWVLSDIWVSDRTAKLLHKLFDILMK